MARKKWTNVEWNPAPDIKKRTLHLIKALNLTWMSPTRIYFIRSNYSSSRAYARIWGFSRVWQMVLNQRPAYIIEVLSERFDKLTPHEQDKVLLHELAHIPKNFSGSLMPHIRRGKRRFHDKVEKLFAQYKSKLSN